MGLHAQPWHCWSHAALHTSRFQLSKYITVYFCFPYFTADSEATSCRAAIRTAQGFAADLGGAARKSPGLSELARCTETHSERDVHQVVAKKFNLALPIPMTNLPKVPGMMYTGEIKVLGLRDWLEYIVKYNIWHLMCGLWKADPVRERAILQEFWRRYRAWRPRHAVFELADQQKLDLSRCAPLMVHGDEGRGRKKSGFLVVSFYSYIGFGTHDANKNRKKREYVQMRLNYGGEALFSIGSSLLSFPRC